MISVICDWCDKTKQGDQGWVFVKEGEFCSDDCREKAQLPYLLTNGRFSYRSPPKICINRGT